MFQYFNFKKNARKKAETPKDTSTWIKHGVSEFLGTILLALSLAGLSTVVANTNKPVELFMIHPIIVAFYAGFIAVGGALFIFLRWSCDLNPAVTITKMLKGNNNCYYGSFKITIQFMGGVIAGLIIYALGSMGETQVHNIAIDAVAASHKAFVDTSAKSGLISGSVWIFFVELIATSFLLFPIFSPMISDKYRDFAIMLIISMAVWMALLGGSAALNPARGIAQQIPALCFGFNVGASHSLASLISATLAMELGTLLAPFFYVLMQGLLKKYLNPVIVKGISYRNYRANNMRTDSSNNLNKK